MLKKYSGMAIRYFRLMVQPQHHLERQAGHEQQQERQDTETEPPPWLMIFLKKEIRVSTKGTTTK